MLVTGMLRRWRLMTNGFSLVGRCASASLLSTSAAPPIPEFSPLQIKPADKSILKKILAKIEKPRGRRPIACGPGDIVKVLFACSKISGSEPALQRTVRRLDARLMRRATAKELGLFMSCFGKLHKRQKIVPLEDWNAAVECVMYEIRLHHPVRRFVVDDAVRIVTSMAAMDTHDDQIVRSCIEKHIWDNRASLSARTCCRLLCSLIDLKIQEKDWLCGFSDAIEKKFSELTAQEVVTVIGRWTLLGEGFKPYVERSLPSVFRRRPHLDLNAKHCASLLKCLARLELRQEKRAIGYVVDRLVQGLEDEEPDPASLTTAISALGRLRFRHTATMNLLATTVVRPRVLSQLTMDMICRVATGWAHTGLDDDQTVSDLAEEALSVSRSESLTTDQLAMLNWSLGKLKMRLGSLVRRLIEVTCRQEFVPSYSNAQLCTILEGWVSMTVQDVEAVGVLIREATSPKRLDGYAAGQVAHLVWSMGRLRLSHSTFYFLLRSQLAKHERIVQLTPEDVRKALVGFLSGGFHDVSVAYFFAEVLKHWMETGTFNTADVDVLSSIQSTLKQLPYIEPNHIHQISRELEKRKTENLL